MKTSFFRCRSVLSCVAYAGLAVNLLLTGRLALANERSKPEDNHKATVTFAKDISRILQNRCQTCHHAGTAAPFTLATYKDAVHWADTIREVVTQNRMPPWHADPHFGTFSNDRRLTDQEKAAILAWIDGGKPMGDKADLPAPRKFADGWVVGQPDVVFDLPEEQTVPATGVVPYLYFVTPTHFKEDVWVQAAEARPGNRAVVHHIVVSYRDPKLGGRETARGFGDGLVVGEAPGDLPLFLPPGMAIKIPAGAELVWQMHYTPNGKPAKDKSQIGLVFYKGKEPPTRIAHTRGAVNASFAIPAGASNYKVESEWVAPRDLLLLSFMPHMHLRGKDFQYVAEYPDGRSEILLNVPRYDFAWQTSYRLAKPVLLPKGTKVHCTAHFDNSKGNPANPDATKSVTWGDQTWEEMMIGWFDYVWQQPEKDALAEGFNAF
jgi:mono/diheme cytochrome c family protein